MPDVVLPTCISPLTTREYIFHPPHQPTNMYAKARLKTTFYRAEIDFQVDDADSVFVVPLT